MKLLFLLLLPFSSWADCARSPLCDVLNDQSFECSETLSEKSCNDFVATLDKTLEKQNCGRGPKTILGHCNLKAGNPFIDLHFDVLASLPYAPAIALYTSEKFRSALDGEAAETHLKKSRADQKKKLQPGVIIPACRQFQELKFTSVKGHEVAVVGEYQVFTGDTPAKILHTPSKNECVVGTLIVDKVSKVPGRDLLVYTSYSGGTYKTTIVEMKGCKKIWEDQSFASNSHTGKSGFRILLDKIQESEWKQCSACWGPGKRECLRI